MGISQTAGIVLFVVVILLVILIHEAGHFFVAKAFRIKVDEFFVGFGPRLWSFRRGETEYGVKAFPAGGYVRIAGMDPYEEIDPADVDRTYRAKPAWQRASVILAGPTTHFLLAVIALAFFFGAVGTPAGFRPQVAAVQPTLDGTRSPAAAAGLRPGDVVVAAAGVSRPSEERFIRLTQAHAGHRMSVTVLRDGHQVTLEVTPRPVTVGGRTVGRVGVEVTGQVMSRDRLGPIAAIGKGAQTTGALMGAVVGRLGDVFGPAGIERIVSLLEGAPRRESDVGSVVGGAELAGQAAQAGAWDFLFGLFASFNVFIGLLNLVPLPPLDGGHLAVVGVEALSRRRVDPRALVPLTVVVAGFMILFMVSVVYLDIANPIPNPFR